MEDTHKTGKGEGSTIGLLLSMGMGVPLYGTVHPHLDGGLWEIVRVPKLRGHVKTEVLRVLNRTVSQLDADAPTLLEGLLQKERLKNWIQLLSDVLQKDGGAELDTVLEGSDEVAVC